jgi:hypothetical protein
LSLLSLCVVTRGGILGCRHTTMVERFVRRSYVCGRLSRSSSHAAPLQLVFDGRCPCTLFGLDRAAIENLVPLGHIAQLGLQNTSHLVQNANLTIPWSCRSAHGSPCLGHVSDAYALFFCELRSREFARFAVHGTTPKRLDADVPLYLPYSWKSH